MELIRYATRHDAEILANIHVKSWQKAYRGIVPDSILDNMKIEKRIVYFTDAIDNKKEEDVLIFKDQMPAGFACIGKCRDEDVDDTYGEVWGIYLLSEFWNQGLGSKLMKWVLEELRNRGYKKVSLWVLEENGHARRFYEKMGFIFDGTIKELTIGKKLNEIRYVKNIE